MRLWDQPIARFATWATRAIFAEAVIAQGAKSLGGDPGSAPLQRRRSHSVPRTGLEPVFPACKAGVLTRLDYRGPLKSSPANQPKPLVSGLFSSGGWINTFL